jgi:Flp pilus assembly protein protease CpaA
LNIPTSTLRVSIQRKNRIESDNNDVRFSELHERPGGDGDGRWCCGSWGKEQFKMATMNSWLTQQTLLSFIITAALAILLSGIIILHEFRKGNNEAKVFRKLLQSFSDQQILYGIGIQCVGLAKMETMVPYHFFIIWMLSLLSTATHLSTLLALVNDFKRDWVLRWLRQFLMFVNLVLSCVFGIFVLMATMKNMAPTLAVACVWELDSKGMGLSNSTAEPIGSTIPRETL